MLDAAREKWLEVEDRQADESIEGLGSLGEVGGEVAGVHFFQHIEYVHEIQKIVESKYFIIGQHNILFWQRRGVGQAYCEARYGNSVGMERFEAVAWYEYLFSAFEWVEANEEACSFRDVGGRFGGGRLGAV
ncbi:MAG TPA: hypothetical protein DHU26_01005 [Spirochaetaceae bacterium]|nr:hypothetical protein [Spirochaetaceae bacterium]